MEELEGGLYIVATPIGNLQDITLRALTVLSQVDAIAAEDTRHTQTLLTHFQINTPLFSFHAHNEAQKIEWVLDRLRQGEKIALVTDAGTPLISDPGYGLVKAAREAGLLVTPIPGVCAITAALSVAALPTDRFVFEGFLPVKAKARRAKLALLAAETRTVVLYEAPHRILSLFSDLINAFGEERTATIARELTKRFETLKTASLKTLYDGLIANPEQQKGEFVVIVAGNSQPNSLTTASSDYIVSLLQPYLPLKKAAQLAAKITGESKNQIYDQALSQL